MPSYVYQVRDAVGGSSTGVIQAPTVEEASQMLRQDGKTIVNLHERVEAAAAVNLRKVRVEDIIYLTNQLAVMVDTGVSLTDAMDGIASQTTHTGLKAVVTDIADQVKGGVEFSVALARHPKCFSTLFVNMVKASESSGKMGAMLEQVCEYMRDQRQIRKQVRGAMLYPVSMMCLSVVLLIAMMTFVMPKFRAIYEGKGAVLPVATRLMMGTSDFMNAHWLLLIVVAGFAGVAASSYFGSQSGRHLLHGLSLRVPLIGPLFRNLYIARSFRTLATMIASGVGVLDAVGITANVVGNVHFANMWRHVGERLREGHTLTDEMFATPLMPYGVSQMIASGEKSGRLTSVMNRVAEFCEADVKVGIRSMTSLIEPAMIVIMGGIVGFIAMAMLLPIFSISKVIAH